MSRPNPRVRVLSGALLSLAFVAGTLALGAGTAAAQATPPEPPRTRQAIATEIDVMKATGDQLETQLASIDSQLMTQRATAEAAAAVLARAQGEADAAAAASAAAKAEADRTEAAVRKFAVEAYIHPPNEGLAAILASSSLTEARERSSLLNIRTRKQSTVLDARKVALRDMRTKESAAAAAKDQASRAAEEQQAALRQLEGSRQAQQQMNDRLNQRIEADLGEVAALNAIDARRAADLAAQNKRIAQLASTATKNAGAVATLIPNQPVTPPVATPAGGPPPTTTAPPRVIPPPLVSRSDLVTIHGITINKSIGTAFGHLWDAASAAGLVLGGGGYRDPAAQIALRIAHCGPTDYDIYLKPSSQCSPPTARPGQSMHEQGLAIDFTCAGVLIGSHADPCWVWLDANAATFGFYNLASEPWHWSVNGN